MNGDGDGLARSVQVRLSRHARAIGSDPNLVLTRYAVERFLHRLSRSPHAERFGLSSRSPWRSPGPAKDANWLPAPAGRFKIVLRGYQPRVEVLDSRFRLPGVERVD